MLDTLPEPVTVALPRDLPRRAPAAPAEPPASSSRGSSCYEVQLLGLSAEATARRAALEAASALGVSTRVASSSGLHRVRAGGCLARDAAEALRERARAHGYPGAFVTEAAR